ncbi:substrate-binding domain-containing protein [Aerococcaceae bacterium WS4759]|uniref:Substrate-binding domain-containing protein n=1 Tax=Fundicoccus ignavus TaxID=2664442 RepID=A0A6I2GJ92_9LACT|nr:substrate-binding domain-containing protein [Fundicoccus ignavus]MRI85932.1 substrate-binding domain-containing protein [Fundicoccus ignavus]
MKKFIKLLSLMLVGLFLVACGSSSETAESSSAVEETKEVVEETTDEELPSVGFSISTLNNPFFVTMADGAEAKAKELGVSIKVVDAGNDPAKQVTDIEDLITTGIDVLIVNPEDSSSVGPAIQSALDAGIKVIAIDRGVDDAEIDVYIGTDNVAASEKVGEYLLELLDAEDQIAILEGVPGASSAIERNEGFLNALEGNIEIVTSQTANFDRVEGMTVVENMLQANPNIKAIVAANDEMALGAIEAINASGRVAGEDILVTGFDANDDALAAVKDGTLLLTVQQKTVAMGETAIEVAIKLFKGETVDAEVPVDVTLVDSENVE